MAMLLGLIHHVHGAVTLRLEPDEHRSKRALARAGGHALSHAEELVPGPLRDLVLAVGARFAESDAGPMSSDRAIEVLSSAVRALAPDARLERRASRPGARGLPLWPSTLRTGASRPGPGSIWPFDPESAGLELGTRRVIKRECFDAESEARDRAWLEGQGLAVHSVGEPDHDGRRVLFAARKDHLLARELTNAEAAIRTSGSRDAAAWLGRELGYPACCVERFVALRAHDDLSLVSELLPPPGTAPASPLTQWLTQPLALVSYAPCSLDCDATVTLAAALLDALERRAPGFARAWESLARRVHVVDSEGRCLALDIDGALEPGGVIRHATELCVPSGPEPIGIARDVAPLVGTRVALASGVLVGEGLHSVAIADHRATDAPRRSSGL